SDKDKEEEPAAYRAGAEKKQDDPSGAGEKKAPHAPKSSLRADAFGRRMREVIDKRVRIIIMDAGGLTGSRLAKASMAASQRHVPNLQQIVVCGDPNQIPSVAYGDFMHAITALPTAELTHFYRSKCLAIHNTARNILDGNPTVSVDDSSVF